MNKNTATIRASELQRLLGVTPQTTFRWLSNPYPLHVDSESTPRGRTYALPEIVGRLRSRSAKLTPAGLQELVAYDASVRASRNTDDMWLGEGVESRADSFFAALLGEERERACDCRKTVRAAATCSGLLGVERLAKISTMHPAFVRFTLTGEDEEMPFGDAGWIAFTKALWAVNPQTEKVE